MHHRCNPRHPAVQRREEFARSRGIRYGRGRGGPVTVQVESFSFAIEPWNAKTVDTELRKRGLTPTADNDGKGFDILYDEEPLNRRITLRVPD